MCKEIRDSVKSAIKSSLDELHKSTELCIGFYSTCGKNQTFSESHIAIVEDLFQEHSGVPEDMTCIDCCNKSCPLKEEHKVWFKEVSNAPCNQRITFHISTIKCRGYYLFHHAI